MLTLTPSAGFNSYLVIAGPTETFSTFAETPKLYNVFCNLLAVSVTAFLPPFISFTSPWLNKFIGGNLYSLSSTVTVCSNCKTSLVLLSFCSSSCLNNFSSPK